MDFKQGGHGPISALNTAGFHKPLDLCTCCFLCFLCFLFSLFAYHTPTNYLRSYPLRDATQEPIMLSYDRSFFIHLVVSEIGLFVYVFISLLFVISSKM